MKLNSFDKVKQLTEEMVAIPSINKEPGGESAVARYIQDFYMSLPYFQAHPEQVKCFQTKNDFVVRHSTLAYVKGTKGNSNRTVILIGHIDTVGVDDFGTIREYAFRCEELPAKLRETFVLPQEVIDDIESGEYLFGRGALDNYSIGFAGWSRSVGAKTAREVLQKLKLYEEYPDYQDFLEGKEPMYQMVEQFEVPLRRLKDE